MMREEKNSGAAEQPAEVEKKESAAAAPGSGLLAYLHDFAWLMAVVLVLFLLCFRVVVVSGPSMKQTLFNGDYLFLVSNTFYHNPQQGDIIVASKETFRNGEPIVKRVIATEGQTVDINFVQGVVYVDGMPLDEPYTFTPTNLQEGVQFPLTVEENCVFVMGDNRNESKDSRSYEIGMVDRRQILGKAVFLLFPGSDLNTPRDFSRIGVLK